MRQLLEHILVGHSTVEDWNKNILANGSLEETTFVTEDND